jgi:hypothetical protein
VDESLTIEIRFKPAAIPAAEINLLESILPEIIAEMMRLDAERED